MPTLQLLFAEFMSDAGNPALAKPALTYADAIRNNLVACAGNKPQLIIRHHVATRALRLVRYVRLTRLQPRLGQFDVGKIDLGI